MTHTEKQLKVLIESYGYGIRDWHLIGLNGENHHLPQDGHTYAVCSYRDAAMHLDTVLVDPEYSRQLEEILNPQSTREEKGAA